MVKYFLIQFAGLNRFLSIFSCHHFQSQDEVDSVVLGESIFLGFCTVVLVFFVNEIGQRCSDAFEKLNGVITEFNWYLFPYEVQRIIPVVTLNAQQPIVIQFFGSAVCSREQFKKVNIQLISFYDSFVFVGFLLSHIHFIVLVDLVNLIQIELLYSHIPIRFQTLFTLTSCCFVMFTKIEIRKFSEINLKKKKKQARITVNKST